MDGDEATSSAQMEHDKTTTADLVLHICTKLRTRFGSSDVRQTPVIQCWKTIFNSENNYHLFRDLGFVNALVSKCEFEINGLPLVSSKTRDGMKAAIAGVAISLDVVNFPAAYANFESNFSEQSLYPLNVASDILMNTSMIIIPADKYIGEIYDKIKKMMSIIEELKIDEQMKSLLRNSALDLMQSFRNIKIFGSEFFFRDLSSLASVVAVCEQNAHLQNFNNDEINKIISLKNESVTILDWLGRVTLVKDGASAVIEASGVVPLLLSIASKSV
jgi:hypothetical protein